MHDDIRKYSLNGEIAETKVVQTRERMIDHLEDLMREYGYVPAIDLDPQFSLNFNEEKGVFQFDLSVYGIFVGKEEAWDISGVAGGKRIPKYSTLATK